MRITCPACGAAYDVPDRAVPDPGRDVQCASCGASWFLLKGGTARATDPGTGDASRTPRAPDRSRAPAGGSAAAGTHTAVSGVSGVSAPEAAADEAEGADSPPDPPDGLPPRRRLDPEVLAILREAAETERQARAAADGATSTGRVPQDVPGSDAQAPARERAKAGGTANGLSGSSQEVAGGGPGATQAPAQGTGVAGSSAPRGRLARLTAAERQATNNAAGGVDATWGASDGDTDHGLVEDSDAARHGPRPPLLEPFAPAAQTLPQDSADARRLPVAMTSPDRHALVVLEQRRRGFRLGFGATAGLCCAALVVYLVVLRADEGLGGPVAEAVLHHGGQVQAALVDWLRRVVVPALS